MVKPIFEYIAIDALLPNPHKLRKNTRKETLVALSDSIRQYGVLQPILVGRTTVGYQIIAGELRWKAAKLAGLIEIPAMVIQANAIDLLILSIEENNQRTSINIIDMASGFKKLLERDEISVDDIARHYNIKPEYVESVLKSIDLPTHIKSDYLEGKLTDTTLLQIINSNDLLHDFYKAK